MPTQNATAALGTDSPVAKRRYPRANFPIPNIPKTLPQIQPVGKMAEPGKSEAITKRGK